MTEQLDQEMLIRIDGNVSLLTDKMQARLTFYADELNAKDDTIQELWDHIHTLESELDRPGTFAIAANHTIQ